MIAPNEQVSFEIERSYLCGDEVADVGTIRTTLPGGDHVVLVRGVYTYRADGSGRIAALRAFWEFDAAEVMPGCSHGAQPCTTAACQVAQPLGTGRVHLRDRGLGLCPQARQRGDDLSDLGG